MRTGIDQQTPKGTEMHKLHKTKSFQVGVLAMIAGSGLATAQGDGVAVDPILENSTESGMNLVEGLPEVIAGPFQHGNQAYYLLEPSTWELSEQAAFENFGAHLVTVNNADENEFIRQSVLGFDGNDRNGWLGFTDRDSEGNYVWANSEPGGYINWQPGEPNGGGAQNYAGMLGQQGVSTWFDLENNWGDLFQPVFGVVEVDIPDIQAGPFYYNGHTYYLLDISNRYQADTAARLLGGHLVTLDNVEESNWVRSNVIEFDGVVRHTWLGLSDAHFEGIYAWDNDSLSTYRSWVTDEPNGGVGENFVIMFRHSNAWFDADYNWSTEVHGVVEIASPNPCPADMNNDGQLNFFDVSEFLGVFGTGCQ